MRINWFFIWRKLKSLHPRMLCAKIVWKRLSGSGEEDFLISSINFCYFVIISPWKRVGPFILRNLNPFQPRMQCAKLVETGSGEGGSGEEDFFDYVNAFLLFRNYLPLEKGRAFHLNKLESPPPKDALCQVWLKLTQWFWRRRWKYEKFTDRRTDRRTDRQTVTHSFIHVVLSRFSGKVNSVFMGPPYYVQDIVRAAWLKQFVLEFVLSNLWDATPM